MESYTLAPEYGLGSARVEKKVLTQGGDPVDLTEAQAKALEDAGVPLIKHTKKEND